MDDLNGSINIKVLLNASKNLQGPQGLIAQPYNPNIVRLFKLIFGNAAEGAVNNFFDWQQNIAANATYTINLNGALTNKYNEAINLTKARLFWFENFSAIDNITVKPSAAEGIAGLFEGPTGLILKPKTGFLLATDSLNGYTVGAATDGLSFINGAGGISTLGVLVGGSQ